MQATVALGANSTLRNQYHIVRQLGAGGMGRAYIALDTKNFNRQCVVKEMLPNWTTPDEEAEAKRNFERECQLLAALSYPTGIPQIFDHFVEANNFYMVMTLIEGEDLEKRMEKSPNGRLPEKEVIKYALQVCDILVYLAKRQPPVIHRDLKPANLIVDKHSGNVMLVDFGIAKATRNVGVIGGAINTATWNVLKSSALGTAGYAPPEQYQGATEPRSDVYALGATMHHLLTGRSPQSAASPFDFPDARQLVPTLSEGIARAVAQALTMNVTARPTAAQLKSDLEAIATASVAQPQAAATGPFHFRSGDSANTIPELVQIAETKWGDGVYHLYQGHIETWLGGQNRHDLADKAKTIRAQAADQNAGLEEFLRAANPQLRPPTLASGATQLDFGAIGKGEEREIEFVIANQGRGYLYGAVKSVAPWVVPLTPTIGVRAGATQTLKVKIDTRPLDEGAHAANALELDTNGGKQTIPAQAQITWVPTLKLSPDRRFDFGNVLAGASAPVTRTLTITNTGGGVLEGTLNAQGGWFSLNANQFRLTSQQKLEVIATAQSAGLVVGVYEGDITITSNMRQVVLPAQMGVKKALYDLSSRAMRWGMFAALMFVSWFSCSLTLGLGTRGILGLKPENQLGTLFADLFRRFTSGDTSTVANVFGIATLLFLGLIGMIAWLIARTQNNVLDEIEDFYHRGYLAQAIAPPKFDAWRFVVIPGLLTLAGLAIGIRFNTAMTRDWIGWGLLIGPLAGAMIGGGVTILGAQTRGIVDTEAGLSRFERIFFVTAGMTVWGGMFIAIRNLTTPTRSGFEWGLACLWAFVGFALVSDSVRLPLRLEWMMKTIRPGLLIAFIAYIIEVSAFALITFFEHGRAQFVGVDFFYTRPFAWGNALQVIEDVMLALTVLVGGLIGLGAVSDSSIPRGRTAKVVGLALIPALVVGAIGMAIGNAFFWVITLSRGWSLGTLLTVAITVALLFALFHYQVPWIERGENALKTRLVRLRKNRPLPNWATRISLAALARDLTPATIGILALLTALLLPLAVNISLSLILVLICLGIVAIGAGIVIVVVLVTARGSSGALKRTP
jgi:serine/threonine protein kinase